jgi:hypothetical protein
MTLAIDDTETVSSAEDEEEQDTTIVRGYD